MMSYKTLIPSQIRAKEYLEMIVGKKYKYSLSFLIKNRNKQTSIFKIFKEYFYQYFYGVKIRIGGHSKGGNLAVYAASNSDKKLIDRIICIYNHDGPGFDLQNTKLTNYNLLISKIKKYAPENCIFGIMLDYLEDVVIVKSDAKGLMQHDAFSWQIEGKILLLAGILIKIVKQWILLLNHGLVKLIKILESRRLKVFLIFLMQ